MIEESKGGAVSESGQDGRRRYPGPYSFDDTDFDRSRFKGRDREADELLHLILSNRLTVVFGASGVGKTSLLRTRVLASLRDRNLFPIVVRFNDETLSPAKTLCAAAALDAKRSAIALGISDTDKVAGHTTLLGYLSACRIFRRIPTPEGEITADLAPCVVLDQFEEVFRLGFAYRERLIRELAELLRGFADTVDGAAGGGQSGVVKSEVNGSEGDGYVPKSPFVVHVCLSIQERFLGFLEDLSGRIPSILSSRYRVLPLYPEQAQVAIVEPARLTSSQFASPPIEIDQLKDLVDALAGLGSVSAQTRGAASRSVEPFQLQLVCQEIETLAIARARTVPASDHATVAISFAGDLGGAAGIARLMQSFYRDATRRVGERAAADLRQRLRLRLGLTQAIGRPGVSANQKDGSSGILDRLVARVGTVLARRVCQAFLLSEDGESRRLLAESDLSYGWLPGLSAALVDANLVRIEPRQERKFYELSHDTLIAPVLRARKEARRRRFAALLVFWVVAGPLLAGFGTYWWRSRVSVPALKAEKGEVYFSLVKKPCNSCFLDEARIRAAAQIVAAYHMWPPDDRDLEPRPEDDQFADLLEERRREAFRGLTQPLGPEVVMTSPISALAVASDGSALLGKQGGQMRSLAVGQNVTKQVPRTSPGRIRWLWSRQGGHGFVSFEAWQSKRSGEALQSGRSGIRMIDDTAADPIYVGKPPDTVEAVKALGWESEGAALVATCDAGVADIYLMKEKAIQPPQKLEHVGCSNRGPNRAPLNNAIFALDADEQFIYVLKLQCANDAIRDRECELVVLRVGGSGPNDGVPVAHLIASGIDLSRFRVSSELWVGRDAPGQGRVSVSGTSRGVSQILTWEFPIRVEQPVVPMKLQPKWNFYLEGVVSDEGEQAKCEREPLYDGQMFDASGRYSLIRVARDRIVSWDLYNAGSWLDAESAPGRIDTVYRARRMAISPGGEVIATIVDRGPQGGQYVRLWQGKSGEHLGWVSPARGVVAVGIDESRRELLVARRPMLRAAGGDTEVASVKIDHESIVSDYRALAPSRRDDLRFDGQRFVGPGGVSIDPRYREGSVAPEDVKCVAQGGNKCVLDLGGKGLARLRYQVESAPDSTFLANAKGGSLLVTVSGRDGVYLWAASRAGLLEDLCLRMRRWGESRDWWNGKASQALGKVTQASDRVSNVVAGACRERSH